MQELSRKVTQSDNGRERRTIQQYPDGIRAVTVDYDGECWHRHVIVPREYLLAQVRRLRANGWRFCNINLWDILPPLYSAAGYGGPGRAFADEPWTRKNRRYYVISQRGGLDI